MARTWLVLLDRLRHKTCNECARQGRITCVWWYKRPGAMKGLVKHLSSGTLLRKRRDVSAHVEATTPTIVRPDQVQIAAGQIFSAELGGSSNGGRALSHDVETQCALPFATHRIALAEGTDGVVPELNPVSPRAAPPPTFEASEHKPTDNSTPSVGTAPTFELQTCKPTDNSTVSSAASATASSAPAAVGGTPHENWTLASWLASLAVNETVARAMLPGGTTDELALMRRLGQLPAAEARAEVLRMLEEGGVLTALADSVGAGIAELAAARAATAGELNDKFVQDGAGMLSYGDLNTFYGGLEGKIGAPNPKVREAMAAEHKEQADSQETFTTDNYDITTTSALEWRFVAEPDTEPNEGWPEEKKLVRAMDYEQQGRSAALSVGSQALLSSGAQMRSSWTLSSLNTKIMAPNEKLKAMGEPKVSEEEAIGARLYTGCALQPHALRLLACLVCPPDPLSTWESAPIIAVRRAFAGRSLSSTMRCCADSTPMWSFSETIWCSAAVPRPRQASTWVAQRRGRQPEVPSATRRFAPSTSTRM